MLATIIIILIVWFIISLFIIIFSWSLIKTKILLKLKRTKDYGIVVEMKDNKSFRFHAKRLVGRNIEINDRIYNTSSNDIMLSDDFGTKGFILNENLRRSINPHSTNEALDSPTLKTLVKRAVIGSKRDLFDMISKIKKFGMLGAAIILIYMVISIYLLFQLTNGGAVI